MKKIKAIKFDDLFKSVAALCWAAVALWVSSNYVYELTHGFGHSPETLYKLFNKVRLEAVQISKQPDRPLAKGWKRQSGIVFYSSASNVELCKIIEDINEGTLYCDSNNQIIPK